ncbi:glycosyltransferase [bacterium 1XD21-13]|nr:glycosyltransferase [bacterium 1XD21-13]
MGRFMKRVSIVLPVYNGEENLEKSIESILNQTYQNIQLIIVDDCSTDKTPDIINSFIKKDSRICLIRNKENLKLPASLNVGFRYADGEYYTWTSDDNMYHESAIETMVNYLEENPTISMVYCNVLLIGRKGDILCKNELPDPEQLLFKNTIGACFLYRSEVANKVGEYDETLFLAEDYDYWLRIFQEGKIKHLGEFLYYYRCHENSLTSTKHEMVKVQTSKVWDKHFKFITEHISKRKQLYIFFDTYVYFKGEQKGDILDKLIKEYKCYYFHRIISKIKAHL